MKRRWTFPLFVVFGIGFAVAALSAAWVATQSLGSKLNQLKLKSAIKSAVAQANQPSDEECRAFAGKIEQAFASGEVSEIDALFDWDAFVEEGLKGFDSPTEAQRRAAAATVKRMRSEGDVIHKLADEASNGGTLKFLRVRDSHECRVVLFRFLPSNDEGVNYFEFLLRHRQPNGVAAVDLYVYLKSELLSQLSIAEQPRPINDRLTLAELRDISKDLLTLKRMMEASNSGRHQEALKLFGKLHAETRKTKNAQFTHCLAARGVNEEVFIAAVDEFKSLFPNDPGIEFLSIDYYTAKEDYPKVIAAIDHIDKLIGGDPYLNVARSSTYFLSGNYAEARRLARKALEQEPTLNLAYNPLLQVSVAQRKDEETLALLKEYDRKFDLGIGDLSDEDLYTEFRKSPQYAEWLAYIKERDGM